MLGTEKRNYSERGKGRTGRTEDRKDGRVAKSSGGGGLAGASFGYIRDKNRAFQLNDKNRVPVKKQPPI